MKTPRILMCPPDYYGIEYEINPWMSRARGAVVELPIHLLFVSTAGSAPSMSHPRNLIVPDTRLHEVAMLSQAVNHYGRLAMETVRKTKSGELIDVALLAGPLVVNGTNVGYAVSFRDIGERKQVEAKLQHDAMHDVLTGLPNRALFLDRLTLAFSRRDRRREQNCGVP